MAARNSAARSRDLREEGSLIAGRYRVRARLGAGGMGAVYRVVDEPTGRSLALKQFGGPAARVDVGRHQLRFRREFHTMARLVHPRVVAVYDYGIDRRAPFYTMELLDGQDLEDLGPVGPNRACELLRDVASALAFLHARRLIHRDVAPRNVRCTDDGSAKLIDFGVLATAGFCGDIAGTAPVISPENVRGLPIDHRADLFGLGALAYWLLTGRHAYPARIIDELEELWRTRPQAPSAINEDVPPELDDLVMSMLSLDPLGRPGTAAEVIDRLSAIGSLAPSPEVEVARGYLASAAMVGRQREMDVLRRRVLKALAGEGGAVVLEAPSGRGKSRLLREVGLEAQLGGATVVAADSEDAGKGPYGLLRAIARALLTAAGDEALLLARPRAAVLARVLPELRERLGPIPPVVTLGPEEERMRAQSELSEWLLDVAALRTLVLLVDDVQRSDEASAAVLASLAHAAAGRHLLVVVALRTDESIRAPPAVTALREVGHRVRVRGLEAKDVEALVRGMFGDVPHLQRLATWMQKAAGGSPLHAIELARHLVDRGIIRYEAGIWIVPEEPRLEGMPKRLDEAMDARVASLSSAARSLGEVLSVHGGELPLSLCIQLAAKTSEPLQGGEARSLPASPKEDEVFAALDELAYEEILVGAGDTYRFRHDGLREALLRKLDPDRRKALHLRVGHALALHGEVSPERTAEVGWHLLRGGERSSGAALLARAGARLYDAQSFSDAIAPLEAALRVYEEDARAPRRVLELRHMLVMVGCYSARNVALKYCDPTIDAFRRYSGMMVAHTLARGLPRVAAILIGLVFAALRWVLTLGRGPSPIEAMRNFYIEVAYTAVVRSFSFHLPEVAALNAMLELFAGLKGRVPRGAYLLTVSVRLMPLGRLGAAVRVAHEVLEILESDKTTPLGPNDRAAARGGAYYVLAMVATLRQDPKALDEIQRLEALKLRYFDVSASLCRMLYHRLRGEEEVAAEVEGRIDLLLVQAGSMWGPESQIVWLSSLAYGLTRDMLGLRRSIDALSRLVEQGYGLVPHLSLARGEYLRERGELDDSAVALERALEQLPAEDAFVRGPALVALAETRLAQQRLGPAKELAEQAIKLGRDPEVHEVTWRVRAVRALALAEAAGGDLDAATGHLDAALAEANEFGSPSLIGSLHEARARVAIMAEDVAGYALHRSATDSWFRATRNPALIARIERLPDPLLAAPASARDRAAGRDTEVTGPPRPGPRSTVVTDDAVTLVRVEDMRRWVSAVLTGCRGPMERAARSLDLLIEAAAGAAGYLYLLHDRALVLVAPLYGEDPPDAFFQALAASLDAPDAPSLGRLEVAWQPDAVPGDVTWHRALLSVERGDHACSSARWPSRQMRPVLAHHRSSSSSRLPAKSTTPAT
jgi:tetratricopeptide (TPR) repeat protein